MFTYISTNRPLSIVFFINIIIWQTITIHTYTPTPTQENKHAHKSVFHRPLRIRYALQLVNYQYSLSLNSNKITSTDQYPVECLHDCTVKNVVIWNPVCQLLPGKRKNVIPVTVELIQF